MKQLAELVWSIVEDWGFKAVDTIISFFDHDERQEDLVKIILQDDYVKGQLNYNGSGSLNYVAVAKQGCSILRIIFIRRISIIESN